MAIVCYSRHVLLLDLLHDVQDGLPVWFAVVRAGCLVCTNIGGEGSGRAVRGPLHMSGLKHSPSSVLMFTMTMSRPQIQ